jgi:hypothetical protein
MTGLPSHLLVGSSRREAQAIDDSRSGSVRGARFTARTAVLEASLAVCSHRQPLPTATVTEPRTEDMPRRALTGGDAVPEARATISRYADVEVVFRPALVSETTRPWLHGDRITMPFDGADVEMRPILEGTQFLATSPVDRAVYFGGTDERPFLVQVEPSLAAVHDRAGEQAFYEALKPPTINRLEAAFGADRTQRQGDVYAFKLPANWSDLGLSPSSRLRAMPVGPTRHVVHGRLAARFKQPVDVPGANERIAVAGLVAEGTLVAPDHAPRQLRGGPHLLAVGTGILPRRLVMTPYSRRWLGD